MTWIVALFFCERTNDRSKCVIFPLSKSVMSAIITIYKAEFKGKEHIVPDLKELSEHTHEIGDAVTYSTKTGKLFVFLKILRDNKIAYGTHFNSKPG